MTLNDNVKDTRCVVVILISSCVVDVGGPDAELGGWSVRLGHRNLTVGIVGEQRFLPLDHHHCVIGRRAPSKRGR